MDWGVSNTDSFPRGPGDWGVKAKASAGRVSPEASSLLGLQMATVLPRPRGTFSLCVYIPGVSSQEDPSYVGLGPHSSDLGGPSLPLIRALSPSAAVPGVRASAHEFGRTRFGPELAPYPLFFLALLLCLCSQAGVLQTRFHY